MQVSVVQAHDADIISRRFGAATYFFQKYFIKVCSIEINTIYLQHLTLK
jgi:hypothetical protein